MLFFIFMLSVNDSVAADKNVKTTETANGTTMPDNEEVSTVGEKLPEYEK